MAAVTTIRLLGGCSQNISGASRSYGPMLLTAARSRIPQHICNARQRGVGAGKIEISAGRSNRDHRHGRITTTSTTKRRTAHLPVALEVRLPAPVVLLLVGSDLRTNESDVVNAKSPGA